VPRDLFGRCAGIGEGPGADRKSKREWRVLPALKSFCPTGFAYANPVTMMPLPLERRERRWTSDGRSYESVLACCRYSARHSRWCCCCRSAHAIFLGSRRRHGRVYLAERAAVRKPNAAFQGQALRRTVTRVEMRARIAAALLCSASVCACDSGAALRRDVQSVMHRTVPGESKPTAPALNRHESSVEAIGTFTPIGIGNGVQRG
jgi:hypothetical protein